MDEVPYVGICCGGPYNGKRMGSHDREQRVAHSPRPANDEIIECSHGAYRFEGGEWHWRDLD